MKLEAYGSSRGHEIRFDEDLNEWVYADDLSSISEDRTCARCGMPPTKDGHDDCIANLPGVVEACCGHGTSEPYVMFRGGETIRGEVATKWMHDNKPLPYWHYKGLIGTPAWYSDAHEEVIHERIKRVVKANEGEERKMRYCHFCEGPIGIMDKTAYNILYVNTGRRCNMCGNEAFDTMAKYSDKGRKHE